MIWCRSGKRVWIGLGVPAAGLLIADPRARWLALPVLAGLAAAEQAAPAHHSPGG